MRPCRLRGALLVGAALVSAAPAAAQRRAAAGVDRVVLVTIDGVRTQELFGGLDTLVARGAPDTVVRDSAALFARFWRPTAAERRAALMPFLWGTLVPKGILYGDAASGSPMRTRNGLGFSYPGYAEIVTGRPQPSIRSNDPVPSPVPTVFEFLREHLRVPQRDIALFGSWTVLRFAAQHIEGSIMAKAGADAMPAGAGTAVTATLDALQPHLLTDWDGTVPDALTTRYALEYLRTARPRALWLGLGEPDEWAHLGRYDRTLESLQMADAQLKLFWEALQSMPAYRGHTTLVVTTDHGRGTGPGPDGWSDHGEAAAGSNDVWALVVGPYTRPVGVAADVGEVHQADIAATLLATFGIDPREYSADAGPPLPGAVTRGPEPPPAPAKHRRARRRR